MDVAMSRTKPRWEAMAQDGKKVMQFLVEGRYVAGGRSFALFRRGGGFG
jgi:hypothetical protein